ncbi:MAG: hypothetical protein LC637_02835 [Xanthomonadaceae bacterium]|nr:hypothetical protein [Xanthomonadaceae bacterium]
MKASNYGVLALIAAVLLLPGCGGKGWKETGSQGAFHFVVVDEDSLQLMQAAAEEICARRRICSVIFWAERAKAATRLPMTDARIAAQIGRYDLNKNTGRDSWMFRCADRPGPNCY